MNKKIQLIIVTLVILLTGCVKKDNVDNQLEKIAYGTIIVSKANSNDNKSSITENDIKVSKEQMEATYELFNKNIYGKLSKEIKSLQKVEIESIKDTQVIKIIYVCNYLSDDNCLYIINEYFNNIKINKSTEYIFSILDAPSKIYYREKNKKE